jgi:hypothetical protein
VTSTHESRVWIGCALQFRKSKIRRSCTLSDILNGRAAHRYLQLEVPLGYASLRLTPLGFSRCLESAYSTFNRDRVADQKLPFHRIAGLGPRLDTTCTSTMTRARPCDVTSEHRCGARPATLGEAFGLIHSSFHWERLLAMTCLRSSLRSRRAIYTKVACFSSAVDLLRQLWQILRPQEVGSVRSSVS